MTAAGLTGAATRGPQARVAFIVGPTGVGKSALGVALAERLDAEIVNGDSRQLYRGMEIGTAKPSKAERARVPHHLFDLVPPTGVIDVAAFAREGRRLIAEIAARGRLAIVVGGSGLYLRALRAGICAGPPASTSLRARLRAVAAAQGPAALHARLVAVDPMTAARLSPNDSQRIVRALEVFELTGVRLSDAQAAHRFADRPFASITLGLSRPRDVLYATINRRFLAMVAAGLIDEVRDLLKENLDPRGVPLNTIGYREIADFIRGKLTLDQAIVRAQQASRQLAKRQLTWFRADPEVIWIDAADALDLATAAVREFAKRNNHAES